MDTLFGSAGDSRYQTLFEKASDLLTFQSQHDLLTGLPNRAAFRDRLEQALVTAQWRGWLPAVVFVGLNRFKRINATLGHAAGDSLLQQVGRRLSGCLGEGDVLARVNGSEFALVVRELEDPRDARWRARGILELFRQPFQAEDQDLYVSASIGFSVYPQDGEDAETLLRNAGAAAYRAFHQGGREVVRFTPDIGTEATERLAIETDLRRAIEGQEFRLLYQPQVDLEGWLEGLEALLSWMHPKHGKISPADFIPVAEESGAIVPIGAWVLREACRQNAEWQREGYPPVCVSVNVSAVEFTRPDFVPFVAKSLAETGLQARWLALELTESTLMQDVEESARKMARLRALGVSLAIDDFGTGYSSLSRLRRFPVDTLKIDRSFLREIESGSDRSPLVEAMIDMAHAMGLVVVAEGVENERQLEVLRRAGCDRIQGFLFGESLPADAVSRLLPRQRRLAALAPAG